MMLNKKGQVFEYADKKLTVGELIIANNYSSYCGLIGVIKEICDGEDKDTGNLTPDIHCEFYKPENESEIRFLEERFSNNYGTKKTLDDIALDDVIMSPNMIDRIDKPGSPKEYISIYLMIEDWACRTSDGIETFVFTNMDEAKLQLKLKAFNERQNGCVEDWVGSDNLIEEQTETSYEAYLDGEYCRYHYCLTIKEHQLPISENTIYSLKTIIDNRKLYLDFRDEVDDMEEAEDLTTEEYLDVISDESIPGRMYKIYSRSSWCEDEGYLMGIKEIAEELISDIKAKRKGGN